MEVLEQVTRQIYTSLVNDHVLAAQPLRLFSQVVMNVPAERTVGPDDSVTRTAIRSRIVWMVAQVGADPAACGRVPDGLGQRPTGGDAAGGDLGPQAAQMRFQPRRS